MFAGTVFGFGLSPRCLNASFGVHCSRVVRALMAWVEISICRALHVNLTFGGLINDVVRIRSVGSCEYAAFACSSILVINGTAPGVLLRVWRPCVRGVFLRWRLAVGFRDVMMGGAFVSLSIVVIGVSSITLCCRSCSSNLTLCSSSAAKFGFNMLVMLVCKFLMYVRPCGVFDAVLVSSVSSSVNARRCWRLVKFGS